MELLFNLSLLGLVVVCVLMTLLILMQKPKQEGLGAAFGGGMTNDMFGAHTVTVLQKGTVWLSIAFFVLSAVVAWTAVRLSQDAADETADYDALSLPAAAVETEPEQETTTSPAAAGAVEAPTESLEDQPAVDAEAPAVEQPTEATEATEAAPAAPAQDTPAEPSEDEQPAAEAPAAA